MKSIKKFVEENKIKMSVEYVDNNPNMNDPKWQANHYKVTLKYDGRQLTTYFSKGIGLKGEPTTDEVLDCLASDASTINNTKYFEDWANELGYDTDSRKAEKIFNTIERQAVKLNTLLGDDLYKELLYNTEGL